MKYVIEHLEPRLFKWCMIEYAHISKIVGKENLIFTNVTKKQAEKLSSLGRCFTKRFEKLTESDLGNQGLARIRACVLDPAAEKILSPSDKSEFDYLVFGGILGDYPPRERTKEELKVPGAARRHIGKEQFPTDNAVAVCKKIIDGTPYSKLKFTENISIDIKEGEAVDFPFKYLVVEGKPLISAALIDHLKKKETF